MSRPFSGQRIVSSTNGAGSTAKAHVKNEVGPLPHTKNKKLFKMNQNPKSKSWNYKILRRKHIIIINLHNPGFGNVSDMTPKAQTKEKQVKWTSSQLGMCIKGYYQESEKRTYRMGENMWKSYLIMV